jgi:hypothetical protein
VTTRAKPSQSWEIAWRHFFRHIDEPRELRRNPIAASFLARNGSSERAGMASLRSALLEALDERELQLRSAGQFERARRQRAIVESNILGHRCASEIASQLHVSRMQLYRERRAICEHLARAIGGSPPATRSSKVAQTGNPRAAAMAQARLLVENGRPEPALVLLDDVARNAGDLQSTITTTSSLADILTARLAFDKARLRIDAARQLIATHEAQLGVRLAFFQSCVDLAAARLTAQSGDAIEARRHARRALDELRKQPLLDESQREIAVDELTDAAAQALREGRFKRFRALLSEASSIFDALQAPNQRQRARLVLLTALLYEETCGAAPAAGRDACEMLARARDIANQAGLKLIAADAALSRAGVLAFGLGDPVTAVREAAPISEFALSTGDPRVIGDFCSYVAGLRNANREFREALKLVGVALRYGRLDRFQEAFVHSVAAQSHFGLGEYRLAGSSAERAVTMASLTGNHRLIGRMLQISALSLHACRDQAACDRMDQAVDLLERFGCWHALRHAYRASGIITGNGEHARLARTMASR